MKYTKSVGFALFVLLFAISCSSAVPETMEEKYDAAIEYMDRGSYSLAMPLFQQVIDEILDMD